MRETFSAAAAVFLEWQRKKKAKRLKFLGLALNLMSCLQQCIIISGTASTSQVQFSAPGSGLWLPVVLWGSWSLAVRPPSFCWGGHTLVTEMSPQLFGTLGVLFIFLYLCLLHQLVSHCALSVTVKQWFPNKCFCFVKKWKMSVVT